MNDTELGNTIRCARYAVLANSEDWSPLVQAIEFAGRVIAARKDKSGTGLGAFKEEILGLIASHFLKMNDCKTAREAEDEFLRIVELRNDSVHNGANARNLAHTCVSFATKFEESLMGTAKSVSGIMVRSPATVSETDPIAFARRLMVVNSFTYIPVKTTSGEWKLLSDTMVARFKSSLGKRDNLKMFASISDVFLGKTAHTTLLTAKTIQSHEPLEHVWPLIDSGLIVVLEHDRLVGVLSAFDLL